jgi:hypothetical protein
LNSATILLYYFKSRNLQSEIRLEVRYVPDMLEDTLCLYANLGLDGLTSFRERARLGERFDREMIPQPCSSTRQGTKTHENDPSAVLNE